MDYYHLNSTKQDVIQDSLFKDFGHLFFPVDRHIPDQATLKEITSSNVFIWYSALHPDTTVNILNRFHNEANKYQIFYSIYSEDEILEDRSKANTGLFFLRGNKNSPFAICNAGGGFMYVGALHDSFPHALKINDAGYNAFVLIYRPDHPYVDLSRAIYFIETHAIELNISKENYSLWGGSAGARMAARCGNRMHLREYLSQQMPQACSVIMQYTGYDEVSPYDAPTFVTVGTNDYIAEYKSMANRLKRLKALGIPVSFHAYDNLQHGFGLGEDTIAEGWINDAIAFWKENMK